MSWIDDWTDKLLAGVLRILQAPLQSVFRFWGGDPDAYEEPPLIYRTNSWEDPLPMFEKVTRIPIYVVGAILGIAMLGKTKLFAAEEQQRLSQVRGKSVFPTRTDEIAPFAAGRADLRLYLREIAKATGRFDDVPDALGEIYRAKPDFSQLATMFNRGIIDKTYLFNAMLDLGWSATRTAFRVDEETDEPALVSEVTDDLEHIKELFQRLPGIGDIINMEVRDAFPKHPTEHPDPTQEHPAFQEWATAHGTTPQVYDWERGGGKPITDELKQGTDYGPQSFASWWMGGREAYTKTYEQCARAAGLEPYWAMKFWEAHWKLPDWFMGRELLYRSPHVDPQMFAQIMRWQDYPPGLIDEIARVAYRPLTRVDVRRMHLRGVLDIAGVFRAYLNFGYNPRNASLMTGFTVTWNMERTFGGVIAEVIKSYSEGAIELTRAGEMIWELVGGNDPEAAPEERRAEFTEDEWQTLLTVYGEIRLQKGLAITQALENAATERGITRQRAFLATAKKQYTGWVWSKAKTCLYLSEHGFVTDRIGALLEDWQPGRERGEHLPTASLLEAWLLEQDMPVETWRDYMHKLGYSDATIQQFLQGVGRLPTRGMLGDFWKSELVTDAEFLRGMARLGYDTAVSKKALDLLKLQKEAEE